VGLVSKRVQHPICILDQSQLATCRKIQRCDCQIDAMKSGMQARAVTSISAMRDLMMRAVGLSVSLLDVMWTRGLCRGSKNGVIVGAEARTPSALSS